MMDIKFQESDTICPRNLVPIHRVACLSNFGEVKVRLATWIDIKVMRGYIRWLREKAGWGPVQLGTSTVVDQYSWGPVQMGTSTVGDQYS